MESIVCLRSAALSITPPSKSPAPLLSFLRHPPRKHLALVGHLGIRRRPWPRLHQYKVSCSSHVPPPSPPPPPPPQPQISPKRDDRFLEKGLAGGRKGRRAAAAGAAVIVACALGAIYMSRGPPVAAFAQQQVRQCLPAEENLYKANLQKMRDGLLEIFFGKKVRGH